MIERAWYGRALSIGGGLAALLPALWMWGFTVDDALIPIRYAMHLAGGAGYRFNVGGPSTDGVTPLPWAFFLALLSWGATSISLLVRVKLVSVAAWMLTGARLGAQLARLSDGATRTRVIAVLALGLLALVYPVGAWAASGLETGLATVFVTLAAVYFEKPYRCALVAGIAATLRPELVVWSSVMALGSALAAEPRRESLAKAACSTALAAGPFALIVALRLMCFGRPGPLALLAKPSDAAHGLAYAGAAALAILFPLAACSPMALGRSSPHAKTLVAAFAAHVLVVVAVGGDWMPYARLLVPVAPSLALVYVEVSRHERVRWTALRTLVALGFGTVWLAQASPAGRHVQDARTNLIVQAEPWFSDAKVVAALDIGWVGAATSARIVDLAGLTDPEIAVLPGGHTSKRVDVAMLLDRGVDTVVLYRKARHVEQRLRAARLFEERFSLVTTLPLEGDGGHGYEIYRRRLAAP